MEPNMLDVLVGCVEGVEPGDKFDGIFGLPESLQVDRVQTDITGADAPAKYTFGVRLGLVDEEFTGDVLGTNSSEFSELVRENITVLAEKEHALEGEAIEDLRGRVVSYGRTRSAKAVAWSAVATALCYRAVEKIVDGGRVGDATGATIGAALLSIFATATVLWSRNSSALERSRVEVQAGKYAQTSHRRRLLGAAVVALKPEEDQPVQNVSPAET